MAIQFQFAICWRQQKIELSAKLISISLNFKQIMHVVYGATVHGIETNSQAGTEKRIVFVCVGEINPFK